jgi:DNA-binding SARP family transcriptional activator
MIRLSTIGPLSVHINDKLVPATNEKVQAAILYLVAEGGKPILRRTFASLFFPNSSSDASAHAGRQLVYRLRKMGVPVDGDPATLTVSVDSVQWDVDALVARGSASASELDALSNGYLRDFGYRQSDEFREWLDAHRDSITNRLRPLLTRQLQTDRANADFRSLGRAARACLALDPLNEEATLASAECLAMAGAKADALHVLDQYIDDVGQRSADLRISPKLLRERISGYVAEADRELSPLIGRDDELQTLTSAIERSASGVVGAGMVWGQAGIGKTRLLDEACTRAALSGHLVARVRLSRHDAGRPFAILRDLGPALLDMPGSLGASPETLAAVRGLCGRGPSQYSRRPENTLDTQAIEADVQRRVIELLDAVAEEQPVVTWIEDVDRVDEASLQLILDMLDDQRRVCVLLAARRPGLVLDRLQQRPSVVVVRLSSLRIDDCNAVIDTLFAQARMAVDQTFKCNAQRISAGVPLFVHLLFRSYLTNADPETLPETLSAALTARLDDIQPSERTVFDAVVILGAKSSEARIAAVTELPRYALMEAMRSLEDQGFLRSSDECVLPSHDLLAAAALRRMPISLSRLLHRSCAELLEGESRTVEPQELAIHWQGCGEDDRAVSAIVRSAEEFTRIGRPREAIALLLQARRLRPNDPTVDEALVAASHTSGETTEGIAAAERLGLFGGAGSPEQQLIAIGLCNSAGRAMEPFVGQLLSILNAEGAAPTTRAQAARLLIIIAEDGNDRGLAIRTLECLGDNSSLDALQARLIYETAWGDSGRAISLAQRLHDLAKTNIASRDRMLAMNTCGVALLRSGEPATAIRYLEEAFHLAKENQLDEATSRFATIIAGEHWRDGNLVEAERWLNSCMSESRANESSSYHQVFLTTLVELEKGDAEKAERVLNEGISKFSRLRENTAKLEELAYRVRIDLARGQFPEADRVKALVSGHLERRHLGRHDVIADTLVSAMRRLGLRREAETIRRDYLGRYRKDRWALGVSLRDLRHADQSG